MSDENPPKRFNPNARVPLLNQQSLTPAYVLADLQERIGEVSALSVTVEFYSGSVATIFSHVDHKTLVLLERMMSRAVTEKLNEYSPYEGD